MRGVRPLFPRSIILAHQGYRTDLDGPALEGVEQRVQDAATRAPATRPTATSGSAPTSTRSWPACRHPPTPSPDPCPNRLNAAKPLTLLTFRTLPDQARLQLALYRLTAYRSGPCLLRF